MMQTCFSQHQPVSEWSLRMDREALENISIRVVPQPQVPLPWNRDRHHKRPPSSNESTPIPAYRWLAGYVLDHKAALKSDSTLSGIPTPPATEGGCIYPSPSRIQDSIGKHLRSKRMDPYVDVQFTSLVHLHDTILATGGNHKSRGPQPKVFKERGTKLSVSGWRSKEIRHPPFILYRFLTSSTGITSEEYRWEVCTDY